MVRRLIEKNDIRVCEKKLAQRNSCLLSSGKRGDLLGELLLRKSKPLSDTYNLTLPGIAVDEFKLMA